MPLTSFYTALTGINNNSIAINVIGDNLANMNTVAFKAGSASFSELLSGMSGTSATGNPISFGLGATLNGINHNNTQGTLIGTGNPIHAAITGNGFFVVSIEGGQGYTRAGNFQWDLNGNLLTADGFQLMGYMGNNGVIDTTGAITPIEISLGQLIPASQTTRMGFFMNLDAQTIAGNTYQASVPVIDSLGISHNVAVTFTKQPASGEWSWQATIPAEDVGGAAGDPPVALGTGGNITFDENGVLTAPASNPTISISGLASGAADMSVELSLFNDEGNPIVSGYGSESTVLVSFQDGFAASPLAGVSIDSSGVLVGTAENGQSIALAQLALATFPNVEGLQKFEGSTFAEFTSAGEPSIGVAGTARHA